MAAFQQHVSAKPLSLAVIRRELGDLLREQPFPPDRIADVGLAVSEACANAVMHAYPDGEAGTLLVTAGICIDGLVITVRDYGCGLPMGRPTAGLGFTLIHALADAVDTTDADPGVAVRMEFRT